MYVELKMVPGESKKVQVAKGATVKDVCVRASSARFDYEKALRDTTKVVYVNETEANASTPVEDGDTVMILSNIKGS